MTQKTINLRRENAFFHACNRGVDRQQLFFSPADYEFYIALMHRFADPLQTVLLAFTLMPNHFHMLILQLIPYGISSFMKRVNETYAKYLNRKRKRVGHLFQDNYIPKWVDSQSYLLYLSRYVHLNPVSSGLVRTPEEWVYSSCGLYLRGAESELVKPSLILDMAGGVACYRDFLSREKVEYVRGIEKYLIDSELL